MTVNRRPSRRGGTKQSSQSSQSRGRARWCLAVVVVLLGMVWHGPPASAEVDTFIRSEEVATAVWTVEEQCDDGTTATLGVRLDAGRESESPNLDDVETFATIRIRGVNCEGESVNQFFTGPVTYTSSPSLQEAHVTGTFVDERSGSTVTLDVSWVGTGSLETEVNQTQFPGFVGIFTSKSRDAVATGTIVVDGDTVVSGSTDRAQIETLEDRNRTLPSSDF